MRAENATDDLCGDKLWTSGRIATLKQMWADGATAAAIAECLGVSRSAVLGKIFRLRRRAPASVGVSLQPHPKQPQRGGIRLLELTNGTCRFPIGEPGTRTFFFCGAPGADLEGGRPYCVRHTRRAYSGAANLTEDGGPSVIAVRDLPPIAPLYARRSYVWRALVKHPASRCR